MSSFLPLLLSCSSRPGCSRSLDSNSILCEHKHVSTHFHCYLPYTPRPSHPFQQTQEENTTLTQTNNIHNQNPMLQRHELEIHRLYRRPHHPILLQRLPIRPLHLLPRVRPLHNRHRRQEAEEIRGREDRLIGQDARGYCEVGGGGEIDAAGEEGEPGCCCGAEDN